MPDIPLLNPVVLRGVVEKFTSPMALVMLNKVNKTPWPYPTATWDVIRGSRTVARPNVPNSEAHIVPRLGRSQESAAFIYLREKKVFEPTTIHWIRTPGQLAAVNAEASVLREITDLNQRFDNFAEFCLWQALTGNLVLDYPDVQANIDYKFLASHKATAGTDWSTATPQQIVGDIRAWKRLITRDGRVAAKNAWTTEPTIDLVFDSFATHGTTSALGGNLLSDRAKDAYYTSGMLPGFMGLDWEVNESVYDASGSAYTSSPTDPGQETLFLPDNAVLLGNIDDNRPIELLQGPTADDEAPDGFSGKFAKTWKDKDPSARQYLLEWIFLPVITRPEQFVYVAQVSTQTYVS